MKLARWIKAGGTFTALLLTMPGAQAADLSLQDAINMALSQNTSLKITQKGEDTAKYALDEAKGNNGFSVTATDSLSTSKSKDTQRRDSNSIGVTGKLPLYSGGRNQANIKKAELGMEAADLTTQRAQENLKLSVIEAYYDALEARKTVAVRQETVDKYQEHFTNVSQLYA
ncbi:MAG: TolC family protein, partial [Selenomonas sp.]|nr:TolC family protein [Selenomonas sp.]